MKSLYSDLDDFTPFFNSKVGTPNNKIIRELFKVIGLHEIINEYSNDKRIRDFPSLLVCLSYLSMAYNSDKSLKNQVAIINANRLAKSLPPLSQNTSGLSKARSRFPLQIFQEVSRRVEVECDRMCRKESFHLYHRPLKVVDGTTLSMPDTPKNQEVYPQPKTQVPGSGFPLLRFEGLYSLDTGCLINSGYKPYSGKETGELALLRDLMGSLNRGDILLGDALYAGYFTMSDMFKKDVDFLFENHGSRDVDYRAGQYLGPRDRLIYLPRSSKVPDWMEEETYKSYPDGITVRIVRINFRKNREDYTLDLITSLIDSKKYPPKELARLYQLRWEVETNFSFLKTTLGMAELRSKSPKMIDKEIWSLCMAYNIICYFRLLATLNEKRPNELSFKATAQLIDSIVLRTSGSPHLTSQCELETFLGLVKGSKIHNRLGRAEPRMKKRRPKPGPRLVGYRHDQGTILYKDVAEPFVA